MFTQDANYGVSKRSSLPLHNFWSIVSEQRHIRLDGRLKVMQPERDERWDEGPASYNVIENFLGVGANVKDDLTLKISHFVAINLRSGFCGSFKSMQ